MISIEEMSVQDLEIIKDILTNDFDDFWTYSVFKNELLNENSRYIMAKTQDQIVGFAGIWKSVDDVHITNIAVKKDFRRSGIASKLLDKLIQMSRLENVNSITLEVKSINIAAINLYLKYGFEKVGARKNYYKGTQDALIMTLKMEVYK